MNPPEAEGCPAGKPLACTVGTAALQPSWLNCAGKCFSTDGKEGAKGKKEKPSNDNTQENCINVRSERNKYNKLCVRQGSAFLLKINGTNGRKIFSRFLLYHDSSQIKLRTYFLRNTANLLPTFNLAKKFPVAQK